MDQSNQLVEDGYGIEALSEEFWESEGSALFDSVDENVSGPSQVCSEDTKQTLQQEKL